MSKASSGPIPTHIVGCNRIFFRKLTYFLPDNIWESPPTVLKVDNETLDGGGSKLTSAIAMAARSAMEVGTHHTDV